MQEEQYNVLEKKEFSSPYKKPKISPFAKHFFFLVLLAMVCLGMYQFGFERGKYFSSETKTVPLEQAVVIDKRTKKDEVDFGLFWKTWDMLKEKHIDAKSLDAQKMMYGAIQGMLSATGDPYTSFFDPEQNKEFSEDLSGSFEGIGAEMGIKQNILTVIAPLSGSPAEKAGVRSGDKVIKIDGAETVSMTLEEAVSKIRGKKNTEVALTIFRNGDDEAKEIKIVRGIVEVKSVKTETFEKNIAYIQISRFGEDTAPEFDKALRTASSNSSKGIILDLRNNPGGYLDVAIQMAGKMLPKGSVAVIEEDHNGKQKKDTTIGPDIASGISTVVLINEGSASASEILAGALRDNRNNVTLLGKKSFGKGSVQELISLPQKSAVKITVAKWLTPNGKQINNEGITPDVEADLSHEDYENDRDPQLDKAKELLLEKIR